MAAWQGASEGSALCARHRPEAWAWRTLRWLILFFCRVALRLKLRDTRLQRGELLARARQHFRLDVEFLARHQIEFSEALHQQCAGILLYVPGGTVFYQFAQFGGQLVKKFCVGHGMF